MKLTPVWADTETRSECPLKTHGTSFYFNHPSTRIQLFSFAVGDGPAQLWSKEDNEPIPARLIELFRNPQYVFVFHNAWFDRNAIEHDQALIEAIGFVPPVTKYYCTMAKAYAHGLPGGLGSLGEALAIPTDARKDKEGKRLVQLFCKPRKQRDGSLKWATPETHPSDWKAYRDYCIQDVIAMRELYRKIPSWNYKGEDLEYWYLDQIVNSRGIQVDVELVQKTQQAILEEQASLATKTRKMTDNEVFAASQRDVLLRFIRERYDMADLTDLKKSTVSSLIESDTTPRDLVELLQVRLDTCTTSTAKYKRIANVVDWDGRIRGTIQFAGAGRTERDSGRMVQVQNYARPKMKHKRIMDGIKAVKAGYASLVGYDIMELASSMLRYTIVAKDGHKLVVSDLANIEGRGLAYLAGEDWKLDAFRDFDAGLGEDLYKAAYGKAFGIDPSEIGDEDPERQIGKILELSMGYQGAAGAFISFALIYKVDLQELADKVRPTLPPEVLKASESFYDWMKSIDEDTARRKTEHGDWRVNYVPKSTLGLDKEVYAPIDALKRLWRQGHPKTVVLWKDCEEAVRMAINVSGKEFPFGNGMCAIRSGKWVRIILPSGHSIPYPSMEVDHNGKLRFKGVDGFTKRWKWIHTHGGKLIENCTQAFARDIFKYGELRVERAGYPIIMPVHDELVAEVPDTADYSVKEMSAIMATPPPWAPDIPLAAKGFEDYRYHK